MLPIAFIDPQEITRYALQNLFEEAYGENLAVTSVAGLHELKQFLGKYKNGIVVIDPSHAGVESYAEQILILSKQYKSASWLLFFTELNENWLKYLLQNKTIPYSVVLKTDELADIQQAVKAVLNRQNYLTSTIQEKLDDHHDSIRKVEQVLTPSEREVLKEIASGKVTREIAQERNVSMHTVITHRKNIFKKLEVNSIHEATRYAIRAGIITVNDYYI